MKVSAIFCLNPVLDDPRFEGFGTLDDSPSLLGKEGIHDDFFPAAREDWNWRIEPLKSLWKPLTVVGRVGSYNDYPCLGLVPAFSERAARSLADLLEPNGELLPLVHPAGSFYVYNCTTIVEIVDQAHSRGSFFGKDKHPACAGAIQEFAIFQDRIQDLTIFRMRELCNWTFVTNIFAERVWQAGLTGFCFDKAWPWPKGTDWSWESRKLRKQNGNLVTTPEGDRAIKAESMIIAFDLNDKKMSPDEKKRISQFQNEIDAQLMVSSLGAPYFGSLEGRKTSKGRTTLILSCPDRHRLYEKLRCWINHLYWPAKPTVLLRPLPFDDTTKCDEPVIL